MTRLLRPLCRLLSLLALISLALALPSAANAAVGVGPGGGTPGTSSNFVLVGSNPLFNRGMNAALTIFDHFVYIGNRTDGSNTRSYKGSVRFLQRMERKTREPCAIHAAAPHAVSGRQGPCLSRAPLGRRAQWRASVG